MNKSLLTPPTGRLAEPRRATPRYGAPRRAVPNGPCRLESVDLRFSLLLKSQDSSAVLPPLQSKTALGSAELGRIAADLGPSLLLKSKDSDADLPPLRAVPNGPCRLESVDLRLSLLLKSKDSSAVLPPLQSKTALGFVDLGLPLLRSDCPMRIYRFQL